MKETFCACGKNCWGDDKGRCKGWTQKSKGYLISTIYSAQFELISSINWRAIGFGNNDTIRPRKLLDLKSQASCNSPCNVRQELDRREIESASKTNTNTNTKLNTNSRESLPTHLLTVCSSSKMRCSFSSSRPCGKFVVANVKIKIMLK